MTSLSDQPNAGLFQGLFKRKAIEGAAIDRPVGTVAATMTTLLVDPRRVRIWTGNGRNYRHLTVDNCRDLIESIECEGKQHVPAIARRVEDNPAFDFEVIAGTRRHFAISWLARHRLPDLKLLISVESLDDEQAFRVADLENRSRQDISDLERARNYAVALSTHYGGHLTQMAARLGVSKGWLSKMVRVAALPDEIVSAFASPADIRVKPAYALCVAIEHTAARLPAIALARQIARAQRARREEGEAPYPANEIFRLLMEAAKQQAASSKGYVFPGPTGLPALSVVSNGPSGMTIKIHSHSGASREALRDAFEIALATARDSAISAEYPVSRGKQG